MSDWTQCNTTDVKGSVSTLKGLRITPSESLRVEPHTNLTLGMGTSTFFFLYAGIQQCTYT
jgi:hypothetical protein